MRSVKVIAKTKESPREFWNLIIDVANWNHLIKFVKLIKMFGEVKEGARFFDVTTIMIFPAIVYHKITKIEKYKKFYMEADMPFRTGKMVQTIDIAKKDNLTYITIEIKFKIYFFLFDFIFGSILKSRLEDMIEQTLHKIKDENQIYKNSEIIK